MIWALGQNRPKTKVTLETFVSTKSKISSRNASTASTTSRAPNWMLRLACHDSICHLELGLDLGCKRFGTSYHQEKVILVLDVNRFRYRDFISDIAGQDIEGHGSREQEAINAVRNWLRLELDPRLVITPGEETIYRRYTNFQATLPTICAKLAWDIGDLPFSDFSWAVADWIANNPLPKPVSRARPRRV
jgi:hypothetical protein